MLPGPVGSRSPLDRCRRGISSAHSMLSAPAPQRLSGHEAAPEGPWPRARASPAWSSPFALPAHEHPAPTATRSSPGEGETTRTP
jgi:hypothetical protein